MGKEYLNNKKFEEAIVTFRNTNKTDTNYCEIEMELTKMFYLLADNIIRAFKFQHVDKDVALQEGVLICFEKLHRFDHNLGKAFPFCTTIILNHFRQLYRMEKAFHDFKIKYHQQQLDRTPHIYAARAKKNLAMKQFWKEEQ